MIVLQQEPNLNHILMEIALKQLDLYLIMQRYKNISNFQDPHSLFTAIYDALSPSIQARLAEHKQETLAAQKEEIENKVKEGDGNHNNKPTDEQYAAAAIYKYESMETFFITHYRPQITKSRIYGQLKRIVMRKNENPRIVLEHAKSAIAYAKKTIELLNKPVVTVGTLTNQDVKDILTYIFCTNNMITGKNDGGINKSGNEKSRKQWDHNIGNWVKVFEKIVKYYKLNIMQKTLKPRLILSSVQLPSGINHTHHDNTRIILTI